MRSFVIYFSCLLLIPQFGCGDDPVPEEVPVSPVTIMSNDTVYLFPVQQDGLWGFVDRNGEMEIPTQYDAAWDFKEGLAPVQKGELIGCVDYKGEEVIPVSFYDIGAFEDGWAYASKDGYAYGYIDPQGNWRIEPVYDDAYDFIDGRGIVEKGDLQGMVDVTGELIIPFFEGSITDYAFNMAMITDKYGMIGLTRRGGDLLLPADFEEVEVYSNLILGVNVEEELEMYDHSGKLLRPAMPFSDYLYFEEFGMVWVVQEEGISLINNKGDLLIDGLYDIDIFSEGYALLENFNEQNAFMDSTGQVITPFDFYEASRFTEGRAVAANEYGLFGAMDTNGDWVVAPEWQEMTSFSERFAFVGKTEGSSPELVYGTVNLNGQRVLPFRYSKVTPFSEGLAAVTDKEKGKAGYINNKGGWVIDAIYDEADGFIDGYAEVRNQVNGEMHKGIINKKGEEIIPVQCKYVLRKADNIFLCMTPEKSWLTDSTGHTIMQLNGIYFERLLGDFIMVVNDDRKYGLYNFDGEELLPCEFDQIMSFFKGVAEIFKTEWEPQPDGSQKKLLYRGLFNDDGRLIWGPSESSRAPLL